MVKFNSSSSNKANIYGAQGFNGGGGLPTYQAGVTTTRFAGVGRRDRILKIRCSSRGVGIACHRNHRCVLHVRHHCIVVFAIDLIHSLQGH